MLPGGVLAIGLLLLLLTRLSPGPASAPERESPEVLSAAMPSLEDEDACSSDAEDAVSGAEETPENALVLVVTGPDGLPVKSARARIWVSRRAGGGRKDIPVQGGRAVFPFELSDVTQLRVEVYGAEDCGAILLEPLAIRAQVVDVRLPPPLSISGVVVDDRGKPVPGVEISARTAYPEFRTGLAHVGKPHGKGFSGEDGAFRIDGLGDRDYYLRMNLPDGYAERPVPVVDGSWPVVAAGTEGHRVVCQGLVTLAVRIVGPRGLPVPRAQVGLQVGGTVQLSRNADEDGWIRIEDANPARVSKIRIYPPKDREDLLGKTLVGELPKDLTIRLDPALPLAGVVRDEDGRVVPAAEVLWRRAGTTDGWTRRPADAEGKFRITSAPVSLIELKASPPDYFDREMTGSVQVVRAGRKDIELVVASTPMVRLRFDDWLPGETGTGFLHFVGESDFMRLSMSVGGDGVLRFAGLDEDDTVEVFVRTNLGRVWVASGLRPGKEVQSVRGLVRSSITGQVTGMPEPAHPTVTIRVLWGLDLETQVKSNSRFEIPGVPPGTWLLKAHGWSRRGSYSGQAEATAGTNVIVEMTPR